MFYRLVSLVPMVLIALMTVPFVCADDSNTLDPNYRHASEEAYENWRDLKYGLRIHWGYYSKLGVEASWPVLNMSNEDKQKYFNLYQEFNPTEFDAHQWMDILERGGLTYFTITTKHHDGFSLFDTKTRVKKRVKWDASGGPAIEDCDLAYSIMDTPFKRDIVKELCDAAHQRGIAIDLYFSHIDWYDADFRFDDWNPFKDENYNNQTDPEGFARFAERHREQIRELLTNYGDIQMMCLDMHLPDFCWPAVKESIMLARQIQPNVLFRERGIGAYGDYTTPENWIPESEGLTDKRVDRPWMVIYTLADIFAYEPDGTKYKSAQWILSNLIDITAKGGNFMVSIGPDEKGNFHPDAINRLNYVGDWLKVNGEAIYKTRPYKTYKEGDIRYTQAKDGKHVYAINLKWPGQSLTLQNVKAPKGSSITLLGVAEPLRWTQSNEGLTIQIPTSVEQAKPCRQAYAFKIEQ